MATATKKRPKKNQEAPTLERVLPTTEIVITSTAETVEETIPLIPETAPLLDKPELSSNEPVTAEAPAEPPSVPPVATAAAPLPVDPATPEALARYDAETVRQVTGQNLIVADRYSAYRLLAKEAKDAKEEWEAESHTLHSIIRDRAENRGKRPQPTLFDSIKEPPIDDWRALPVTAGHFTVEFMREFDSQGIKTLGEVSEWIKCEKPSESDLLIKAELDAAIQRWEKDRAAQFKMSDGSTVTVAMPAPDPLSELWRKFPLDRWTEYGVTAKDLEKLQNCEAKVGPSHPITTVGELNQFTTPYPDNPSFSRTWKDIKGFGDIAANRLSDAEPKFWAAWNNGLQEKFAAECGLIPTTKEPANGDQSEPGTAEKVPSDGGPAAEQQAEPIPE